MYQNRRERPQTSYQDRSKWVEQFTSHPDAMDYHQDYRRKPADTTSNRKDSSWSTSTSLSYIPRVPRRSRHASSAEELSEFSASKRSESSGDRPLKSSVRNGNGGQVSRRPSATSRDTHKHRGRRQLVVEEELDFSAIYGVTSRKLVGPVLLALLVLVMLVSLGLAIYFALGRKKEADFSTANIRLRIVNSTYGENLDYLSKPDFERLSQGYCEEMDHFYLQSTLKEKYRGCEVLSVRKQFINFTLYFKEKDISKREVESVIETSAKPIHRPQGKTALVDKLEIEVNNIRIVISQKTEEENFDRTRVTKILTTPGPPPTSPRRSPTTLSKASTIGQRPREATSTATAATTTRHLKTVFAKRRTVAPLVATHWPRPSTPPSVLPEGVNPCAPDKNGELLSHPTDCDKFVQCVYGRPVLKTCGNGTWFNSTLRMCYRRPPGVLCSPGPAPHPPNRDTVARSTTRHQSGIIVKTTVRTTVKSTPKTFPLTTRATAAREGGATAKKVVKEGVYKEPCTTSLNDQYFSHPQGCSKFIHCRNGTPSDKSCPAEFVFDLATTACLRNISSFVCPDFYPCRRKQDNGGYYSHPYNCSLYIQCQFEKEKVMACSKGLVFDPKIKTCTTKTRGIVCPEDRR